MGISNSISRLTNYFQRHGLIATVSRAVLAVKRALFSRRMVVYYCDLATTEPEVPLNFPDYLRVERVASYAGLSQPDFQEMTNFWNPRLAQRNIRERFEKGASLWLIKSEEKLAGYGWTLQGATIEPHYFPLAPEDVHLFDFHVFPQYRGRGINPLLVTHILRSLAAGQGGRAFIEAAEWNQAQLSSLEKTAFRRLGMVRTVGFFGQTFSCWSEGSAAGPKEANRVHQSTAVSARANERRA
jgi:ribosomal protein S18 acetylase RimI-like enzyme